MTELAESVRKLAEAGVLGAAVCGLLSKAAAGTIPEPWAGRYAGAVAPKSLDRLGTRQVPNARPGALFGPRKGESIDPRWAQAHTNAFTHATAVMRRKLHTPKDEGLFLDVGSPEHKEHIRLYHDRMAQLTNAVRRALSPVRRTSR